MNGASLGMLGALLGTLGGCIGAFVGGRESYRSAVNDAQRGFYRSVFLGLIPMGIAFLVIMWAVVAHMLPSWVYETAIVIWLVPIGPMIYWTNRRLNRLACESQVPAEHGPASA